MDQRMKTANFFDIVRHFATHLATKIIVVELLLLLEFTLSPCAFSSVSSSDQHDVPPRLSSFHCCFPQFRQIHSSSFMYFIHPLFSWSTSFSSSFSTCHHHFLSNPFDLMICPKNPSFLLIAICCNVSSFSTPIFRRTSSFVFFSIHDILCIFLHIHISQALIFFSKFFVIVHVSQPYSIF